MHEMTPMFVKTASAGVLKDRDCAIDGLMCYSPAER